MASSPMVIGTPIKTAITQVLVRNASLLLSMDGLTELARGVGESPYATVVAHGRAVHVSLSAIGGLRLTMSRAEYDALLADARQRLDESAKLLAD